MIPSRNTILITGLFLGVAIAIPLLFSTVDRAGWWAGTALGLLAPLLHWMATRWILRLNGDHFHSAFFLTLLLRTILVLALFITLLAGTKIGKIAFTLSFIISYIFHSVIDIILIQQTEFIGRSNS